jgi:hypothetical protein
MKNSMVTIKKEWRNYLTNVVNKKQWKIRNVISFGGKEETTKIIDGKNKKFYAVSMTDWMRLGRVVLGPCQQ